MIDHSDAPDMISQKVKAASELAAFTYLRVFIQSYIEELFMGHEEFVFLKKLVLLAETVGDTAKTKVTHLSAQSALR